MNVIDNIVSFVNPKAGLKRAQQRTALEIVKRGYEAARKSRKDKGWKIVDDPEIERGELMELRKKSRNLYQNNPYAKRAHQSIKNNAIGTGILPAIKDEKVKEVWKAWAESTSVDFDEQYDFYGLQAMITETMTIQGNVLILRVKNTDKRRVPLELKVVTINYLDTSRDSLQYGATGWIKGGIEYYANGKRKGYWIYDQDPASALAKSRFWKKEDVIHLYEALEPGQELGVPLGVSSILSLRDFDDYAAAQLMKQKIAACYAVFVTNPDGTAAPDTEGDNLERVEPGIIEYLEPGKQVSFASPPAAEGYGEYSRNVLTAVASGFGITYEAMTGDLSNVNFSSGRMGWMESGRNIEALQWFTIIPEFCKRVYEWFVEAGKIAMLLDKSTPSSVEWTAPRRQMIDPAKETKGLRDQIRAGLMSWQEGVRSLGYTPEEIIAELISAKKLFDDAGLMPDIDPRFDAANRAIEKETEDDSDTGRK